MCLFEAGPGFECQTSRHRAGCWMCVRVRWSGVRRVFRSSGSSVAARINRHRTRCRRRCRACTRGPMAGLLSPLSWSGVWCEAIGLRPPLCAARAQTRCSSCTHPCPTVGESKQSPDALPPRVLRGPICGAHANQSDLLKIACAAKNSNGGETGLSAADGSHLRSLGRTPCGRRPPRVILCRERKCHFCLHPRSTRRSIM